MGRAGLGDSIPASEYNAAAKRHAEAMDKLRREVDPDEDDYARQVIDPLHPPATQGSR